MGVVLSLAMIALNAMFLYYMDQLKRDGCKCAMNWRRMFAEGTLALLVVVGLADMFGYNITNVWVRMLTAVVFVSYVVITRQFIHMVQETHCSCANSKTFAVLNIVNYIQIAVLCFVLLEVVIRVGTSASALPLPSSLPKKRK